MSDSKSEFDPRNIPAMLRFYADMFERGEQLMPSTVMLVMAYDEDSVPRLYQCGDDSKRLRDIGALAYAQRLLTNVE